MEAAPRIGLGVEILQTSALPLGYAAFYILILVISEVATRRGLEPLTSAVTGRHSNQLNYRALKFFMVDDDRIELPTSSV